MKRLDMNLQQNMYKKKCAMCGKNKSPIDLTFVEPFGYYCKYPYNSDFSSCSDKIDAWIKTQKDWNKWQK